jgi:hypothetical protein
MSEVFDGTVEIQDGSARTTVELDGNVGQIVVGGNGALGRIAVQDDAGQERARMSGSSGAYYISNGLGQDLIEIGGTSAAIVVRHALGTGIFPEVLTFSQDNASLVVGGQDVSGTVTLRNRSNNEDAIVLDGDGAKVTVRRNLAGTLRDVLTFDGEKAALYLGAQGSDGDVLVRDAEGRTALQLDGDTAALFVGTEGNEGDVIVRDGEGRTALHLDGNKAALFVGTEGNEGDVIVRDADGEDRIHLDGASGEVKLLGADCAEDFPVRNGASIEAGTVLVIDWDGSLRQSAVAYDRRVAGVVSGGGFRPGIVLDKQHGLPDRRPVALVGKVYCKVDADFDAIAVGDLLTTSDTPGHAMKATDPLKAFGAVIGKALAPLARGRGTIPILVALQ